MEKSPFENASPKSDVFRKNTQARADSYWKIPSIQWVKRSTIILQINFNPLNPDKKPVVGSPTLGLQQKNPKNLFSNVLPW